MNISLRPFALADQEFLFQLYAETRRREVAAWGWNHEQQDAFLRMQFNAQQRWYEMAYEGAEHQIIECETGPIGRIMVMRGDSFILLVDIALLAEYRGRGIGSSLLGGLLDQGDRGRVPVRLRVLKTNPARRLYERLGFVPAGEDEMYLHMDRLPKELNAGGL